MMRRNRCRTMVWILGLCSALLVGGIAGAQKVAHEPETKTVALDQPTTATIPAAAASLLKSRPLVGLEELPGFFRAEDGQTTRMSVLLSSDFEATFPNDWTAFSNGGPDVFWGRSTLRSSTGLASAWCAQRGAQAPNPGSSVPPGTQSWMVAGPFDLSSATTGSLDFDLWLQTESGFDFFFAGASVDGVNFAGLGTDQSTNGFASSSFDLTNWGQLGDLTTQTQVWFSFFYLTDGSVTFEGAYVDNVFLATDVGVGSDGLNLVINQIDASSCPTVQTIVSVVDDQNNPIAGLTEANFSIQEDGVTQTFDVSTPTTGGGGLAVTLVLDGSGSLSNTDIGNIQTAGNEFIDLLAPGDRVAVYHFGTAVDRVLDYTPDRTAARAAVNSLTNNLGFTSLFDATVDAANYSTTVSGRKALIVMTDGLDNDSSASLQDAIDAARAAGVPVFTIGFGNADLDVLMQLGQQTGGLIFQGVSSADLQTIFQQVGQTLNSQFILTHTAQSLDGGVHSVDVQVQSGGLSASASGSYSQAGTACANAGVCTPGPTTLCLNNGRFRVEATWNDFQGGQDVAGAAACGTVDSGLLWFFNPDNWEILIKVLDACGVNDRYWVFMAATTNVGYNVTVTDTQTGVVQRYVNPLGVDAPAVTDTDAFATCP
ncbi:MAG: VWA domain-containing protein [Acidobacteriota bacterium]